MSPRLLNALLPVLGFLACWVAAAQAQVTEQDAELRVRNGDKAFLAGDWWKAVEHYSALRNEPAGLDRKYPDGFRFRLGRLARSAIEIGQFDLAERALTQCQQLGGDPGLCEYYRGMLWRAARDYQRAETHLKSALQEHQDGLQKAVDEKRRGYFQRELANVHNELGQLFRQQSRYGEARAAFEEAAAIWGQLDPNGKGADRGYCYGNLADLCREQGLLPASYEWFNKSRAIWDPQGDHPGRALCLMNQGLLYATLAADAKQPAANRAAYEKAAGDSLDAAYAIMSRQPQASPAKALNLSNLGWILHGMGRVRDAEQRYEECEQVWASLNLQNHPERARTLCNYGWLLHCTGKRQQALNFYTAGLQLRVNVLGPQHHSIIMSKANIAALHASNQNWGAARQDMTEALQLLRGYEDRELAYMPDADQLRFLLRLSEAESHASLFHTAVSLAKAAPNDPEMARTTAEWVINAKAVSHEALAQKALQTRALGNSDLLRQLVQVQSSRAQLAVNPPGDEQKFRAERDRLRRLEADLELRIARQLKDSGLARPEQPWVPLKDVCAGIPDKTVLIEFARYRLWDFAGTKRESWAGDCYGAWIIGRDGRVAFLDLGLAKDIDDACDGFQQGMRDAAKLYGGKDSDRLAQLKAADAELRAGPLKVLEQRVLAKLEKMINPEAKRWIVSPDAKLWLTPLTCLTRADGKQLVETHFISQIVTGRDLGRVPQANPSGPSLILGDPDYGQGARTLAGKELEAVRLRAFPAEVKEIRKRLDDAAEPLTAAQASEAAFRAIRGPRVLHLVTHGFALRPQSTTVQAGAYGAIAAGEADPLNLCGITLAGFNGNHRREPHNDGLLMGKEVLAVDLRGTDLVTLSACETGLGEVNTGESVASLRQAFHLAGAKNVLATLWEIPDAESAQIMVGFYEQMKKAPNLSKSHALCLAQRETLGNLRKRGQTHPFYWAAFTLTGRDEAGR